MVHQSPSSSTVSTVVGPYFTMLCVKSNQIAPVDQSTTVITTRVPAGEKLTNQKTGGKSSQLRPHSQVQTRRRLDSRIVVLPFSSHVKKKNQFQTPKVIPRASVSETRPRHDSHPPSRPLRMPTTRLSRNELAKLLARLLIGTKRV